MKPLKKGHVAAVTNRPMMDVTLYCAIKQVSFIPDPISTFGFTKKYDPNRCRHRG